jgi:hypothetical protein
MKKNLFFGFLFLVIFSGFEISADCLFCGMTHKVTVELKNGSKITGYIDWNSFALDPFLGDSSPDYIKQYVKDNDLIKNRAQMNDDVLFKNWARLKTLALQKNYEGFGSNDYTNETFDFYKSIHEYPWGLGVLEKDFILLKNSDLIGIIPEKQDLRLGLNNSGIAVYTEKEIKLLLNKKPIYFIEFVDGGGSSTMRVSCYNPEYSFKKIMDDISNPIYPFDQLIYKGVTISSSDSDGDKNDKLQKSLLDSSEAIAVIKYFDRVWKATHNNKVGDFDQRKLVQKLKLNGCVVQCFDDGD